MTGTSPWNLKFRLHRLSVNARRARLVRGVETIDSIRKRHGAEFDAVRDRVRELGTDSLSHFGNQYRLEGGWYLQQNPDEFAALTLILKDRGPHRQYLEIGSASGGAARFLAENLHFETMFSLDDGNHPRAPEQKKNFSNLPNFRQFLGDSHSAEAKKFLDEHARTPLDVAFIDGDHSYEGVTQDVELTLPFCRKGAVIIFHDTLASEGVERAWLEALDKRLVAPIAEFIGEEKPLGIGVAEKL